MTTKNEEELMKAIHVLTESVASSFKMQAGLCRVLSGLNPAHAAKFEAVASGADTCASNLLLHLPKLSTD
jgi:hypothetical protein